MPKFRLKCLFPCLYFMTLFQSVCLEGSEEYTEIQDKATLPILTPSFAKTSTAKIQLNNGLQAYLISDPNADQSAAALLVQVGSWDDPKAYPGLAHFLEHMLFLGTKKYPNESEYDRYIKEHGGSSNAYTTNDYTCFLFSIDNSAFTEALDRFSYFFKEPLFNPSGVNRELNAIDQEYAQNLDNDDVRQVFTLKAMANPEHPYHAFNIGNSSTLSKVSQEILKEWYLKHYSSHLMRLMIVSSLPLDQLKKMVVQDFSGIPNTQAQPTRNPLPLFSKTAADQMVYVEPIKNIRELTLVWDVPGNVQQTMESKPDSLISFVLGHEGTESLLAELKREELADALNCGSTWLGPNNQEIYLNIELTDLGVHQVDKVIERVFQALAILRQKGIPPYLFNEIQQMDKIHYQYPQREDAFGTLFKHTVWLNREDLTTFPLYSQVIQKYDPKAIEDLLKALTPDNCHIMVTAPSSMTGVKTDQTEPWLGVHYATVPIKQETLKKWQAATPHPQIDLPAPNPYIPEHLSLVQVFPEESSEVPLWPKPSLIMDDVHAKIYYAPDSNFQQPKVCWIFEIKTPAIDNGRAESVVLADVFVKNALENLNTTTYSAAMAGLNFSIARTENGIALSIEGYSDKAHLLLDEILKKFLEPITEQNFKKFKDILLRDYQNAAKESPLQQASELFKEIIYKKYAGNKSKATALRRISFKKYNEFFEKLFKINYVEGLMFGNVIQNEAKEAAASFYEVLKGEAYPLSEQQKTEVIILPDDKGPFYLETKVDVKGNAAFLAIENPHFDFQKRAAQQILMQAMNEPFFAQLRTQQQTGYIVASAGEDIEKQLFDFFGVQTNTHDPRDLLARFELFIEGYLQELEKEIPPERFETFKKALVAKLQASAKNINEMGQLLNKIAFKYHADFDWMKKRIDSFNALQYQQFLTLSREFLGKTNKRRLGLLIKGNLPKDNQFSYTRLPLPTRIRAMSTFTAEDP